MSKEAMKLALEALNNTYALRDNVIEAIKALEEALAQSRSDVKQKQGEPVAALFEDGSIVKMDDLEFVPEKSGQRVQMLVIASQTTQQNQPDLDAICQDLQEKTYTQAMRIADLEKDLTVSYIRGHEDGKKAAKQEQGEPVAIVVGDAWQTSIRVLPAGVDLPVDTKLYTHPQPKQEQGEPVMRVRIERSKSGGLIGHVWWIDDSLVEGMHNLYTTPQPKQELSTECVGEPVGFYDAENKDLRREIPMGEDGDWWQPVYTTPQQRTWVGLTYDERISIIHEDENRSLLEQCEQIEAKLKEKNSL